MKLSRVLTVLAISVLTLSICSCSTTNNSDISSDSISDDISSFESIQDSKTSIIGEYYTITLEYNGGTGGPKEIIYTKGETLFLPDNVTKQGFIFLGWYIDEECITLYTDDYVIDCDTTFYAGYMKEYIEINSIDDFKKIDMNSNYILNVDLNFNGATINPIGTYDTPYKGVFNGNNHTISNFNLSSDSIYHALFGYVEGKIINLKVDNTLNLNIGNNSSYVSLIIGYLYNGEVSNCSSSGIINVTSEADLLSSYVGGVVARNDRGVISKCYSTAILSNISLGTTYTGGIVAYNGGGSYKEAKVINSYAREGNISSSSSASHASSYAGGVVGFNFGTVDKCFSANQNIKSSTGDYQVFAGGVVADNNGGHVSNCFSTSNIEVYSSNGNSFRGGVIGRNFKASFEDDSGSFENCYSYKGQIIDYKTNNDNSHLENRHHKVNHEAVGEELLNATWYQKYLEFSEFLIKDNYYPSLNTNFKKISLNKPNGTEINPIEISNASDLLNIDNNKSYILKNDISLKGVNIKNIGSYDRPFFGTFDGNNHSITDININSPLIGGYNSLFGYVNGRIINLTLSYKIENFDALTSRSVQYFGAISYLVKGFVKNVKAEGVVEAKVNSGIVGGLVAYLEDSIVESSNAKASISMNANTPTSYIGGCIGVSLTSFIRRCYSEVSISSKAEKYATYAGFIAKNQGVIEDAYAITTLYVEDVEGSNSCFGGFVGNSYQGNIKNTYCILSLNIKSAESFIYGIYGGKNETNIYNSYYFMQNDNGVLHSFGYSNVFTELTRLNRDDLSSLASKLSPSFIDDELSGHPLIKEKM